MRDLLDLVRWLLLGLVRTRTSLQAEKLALRHQLDVLHRRSPKRPGFSKLDRLIFVCLYRFTPRIREAFMILEPQTIIRWHRAGFRSLGRWKSRGRAGRPQVLLTSPSIGRLFTGAPTENRKAQSSAATALR
jgi:hypothetical protein